MTVAALFVYADRAYAGVPGVEIWDEERDARRYSGPHPVVAHPPCHAWCQLAEFRQHTSGGRLRVGEDGGCFASALASVRKWGGVLEHPANSKAWEAFGLRRPPGESPYCGRWERGPDGLPAGGWVRADGVGGWTCCVAQRQYGHRATKATWLYAAGLRRRPALPRGPGKPSDVMVGMPKPGKTRKRLSGKRASDTPPAFRDLLLAMARQARV